MSQTQGGLLTRRLHRTSDMSRGFVVRTQKIEDTQMNFLSFSALFFLLSLACVRVSACTLPLPLFISPPRRFWGSKRRGAGVFSGGRGLGVRERAYALSQSGGEPPHSQGRHRAGTLRSPPSMLESGAGNTDKSFIAAARQRADSPI